MALTFGGAPESAGISHAEFANSVQKSLGRISNMVTARDLPAFIEEIGDIERYIRTHSEGLEASGSVNTACRFADKTLDFIEKAIVVFGSSVYILLLKLLAGLIESVLRVAVVYNTNVAAVVLNSVATGNNTDNEVSRLAYSLLRAMTVGRVFDEAERIYLEAQVLALPTVMMNLVLAKAHSRARYTGASAPEDRGIKLVDALHMLTWTIARLADKARRGSGSSGGSAGAVPDASKVLGRRHAVAAMHAQKAAAAKQLLQLVALQCAGEIRAVIEAVQGSADAARNSSDTIVLLDVLDSRLLQDPAFTQDTAKAVLYLAKITQRSYAEISTTVFFLNRAITLCPAQNLRVYLLGEGILTFFIACMERILSTEPSNMEHDKLLTCISAISHINHVVSMLFGGTPGSPVITGAEIAGCATSTAMGELFDLLFKIILWIGSIDNMPEVELDTKYTLVHTAARAAVLASNILPAAFTTPIRISLTSSMCLLLKSTLATMRLDPNLTAEDVNSHLSVIILTLWLFVGMDPKAHEEALAHGLVAMLETIVWDNGSYGYRPTCYTTAMLLGRVTSVINTVALDRFKKPEIVEFIKSASVTHDNAAWMLDLCRFLYKVLSPPDNPTDNLREVMINSIAVPNETVEFLLTIMRSKLGEKMPELTTMCAYMLKTAVQQSIYNQTTIPEPTAKRLQATMSKFLSLRGNTNAGQSLGAARGYAATILDLLP